MKSIIITVCGLIVGVGLVGAGTYYLIKEKGDRESVKIYGIFAAIGAVILIGMMIKILVAGF